MEQLNVLQCKNVVYSFTPVPQLETTQKKKDQFEAD